MKSVNVNTSWLLLFCGLNLLLMHSSFLNAGYIDDEVNYTAITDCILGIVLDIFTVYIFSYAITWKRQKVALKITFITTLAWSFSNVLYSRFFHHYISLSAISQSKNLLDSSLTSCVLNGLEWTDLYYIISFIIFFIIIKKIKLLNNSVTYLLSGLIIIFIIDICSYIIYCIYTPEYRYISYFLQQYDNKHFSTHLHLCHPNNSSFRRGCTRTLLHEFILNITNTTKLTEDKISLIDKEINNAKSKINPKNHIKIDNIIFIITESYMSFVSDMKINGQEVTPFLNKLKKDSTVYYNGYMHENVTVGESSDGQFIYMTGLLPLRSVITITKARDIKLPQITQILSKNSRMIIPTLASLWNQDEMCKKYGFKELYTSNDYWGEHKSILNDEQIFKLAIQKDNDSQAPFFSVILTMTMHQPYTQQIDSTFLIKDTNIPKDLACYLNACHYTDTQIKKYFNHLNKTGLYEKSLILITSDHAVHNTDFGGVCKNIPLYIINIPQDIQAQMWKGECNQLDVFTTLLDLLDCKSKWYGLGHSLLSSDYQSIINNSKWDMSDWIISGDYFSNKNNSEIYNNNE